VGTTPAAGPGLTGRLGIIHRSDGSTQVTYNGKPLYFYAGDVAPGDTNGNYPGWAIARP
jgi:predicted lipoprotein with Yx(FWY)xxD motif